MCELITLKKVAHQEDISSEEAPSVNSRNPFQEVFFRCAPWVFFLGSLALLLRPVLLTAIAADDLINPFSQIYHAGNDLPAIFDRTWKSVSSTGHFNYLGQSIGSLIVAVWSYLIGGLGIRYSLVYAMTKFLVFLVCIEVTSRTIRQTLLFCGQIKSLWSIRLVTLLAITLPIQIHIPWSNDPVASYPLSGYLTATIGLAFILQVFKLLNDHRYGLASVAGLTGVSAVLYYEFNAFAVLSVAPLLGFSVIKALKKPLERRKRLITSFLTVFPAAATTVFFYLRNNATSVDYSGTAVSFESPFAKTFYQGVVGILPGSSWNIAFDWLPNDLSFSFNYWRQYVLGIGLFSLIYLFKRFWIVEGVGKKAPLSRVIIAISPFFIYWMGATFTQTSTVKVQQEALRIGQVYNYYAVGAVCSAAIVAVLLMRVDFSKLKFITKSSLIALLFTFGAFQFVVNWNVTTQFNGALSGNRNLLVAFADRPPMVERCQAFDAWKSMGWPEYYWLDMELGMNESYRIYHGEEFCKR
jgi:hypothetical protein